jgi:hypothetical protein
MNKSFLSIAACASIAMLAACSSDTEGEGDGTGEEECPAGQVFDGRRCVRDSGNGGTDSGGGDRDDTGGGDEDAGGPDEDVAEGTCTPGETRCTNGSTVGVCNADGETFTETACEDGRACSAGECVIGAGDCTPNEVLGCSGGSAIRRCAADGINIDIVACPEATPNCLDSECTAQVCTAGERSCIGNDIVECNAAGEARDLVRTCEDSCDAGQCVDPCAGGGKTYVGCAFWAIDLDQFAVACTSAAQCGVGDSCQADGYCSNSARSTPFAVSVSNSSNRDVNVVAYANDGTELARATVSSLNLATLSLPQAGLDDTTLNTDAVRIEADGPVTMHQFNPATNVGAFSNDASLLLPATAVGREYIINGYTGIGVPAGQVSPGKPYIAVIAVAEGTTDVTVTPTTATLASADGSIAAIASGATQTFTLNQGETLSLSGGSAEGADFSGSIVSGTQPIAVFSGTECSGIPAGVAYCDHIEEQLTSVDTWGVEFVAAGFKKRGTEDTVWRIVASVDGTRIRTVPSSIEANNQFLDRGEVLEFRSNQDFFIGGSAPISVASFMVGSSYPRPGGSCERNNPFGGNACAIPATCPSGSGVGDPAFMLAVPNEQFRTDYIVLTPEEYERDYFTIVAPVGAVITVDGNPATGLEAAVGGYNIYRPLVTDGVHRVQGDQEFGLYAYGYDCDVSYAYPGGLNLESITP